MFEGADPEKLDALGRTFGDGAQHLDDIVRDVRRLLPQVDWRGGDRARFEGEIDHDLLPKASSGAQRLREAANDLRRQADEQRRASEGRGGSGSGGPSGAPRHDPIWGDRPWWEMLPNFFRGKDLPPGWEASHALWSFIPYVPAVFNTAYTLYDMGRVTIKGFFVPNDAAYERERYEVGKEAWDTGITDLFALFGANGITKAGKAGQAAKAAHDIWDLWSHGRHTAEYGASLWDGSTGSDYRNDVTDWTNTSTWIEWLKGKR